MFCGIMADVPLTHRRVRLWHLADILSCTARVRFRGNSGHPSVRLGTRAVGTVIAELSRQPETRHVDGTALSTAYLNYRCNQGDSLRLVELHVGGVDAS